jgi:hypothetical protein
MGLITNKPRRGEINKMAGTFSQIYIYLIGMKNNITPAGFMVRITIFSIIITAFQACETHAFYS